MNYHDWVEFYNNGSSPIDLSRWRLDTNNQRFFINHVAKLNQSNQYDIDVDYSLPTILNPGDYTLVSLPRSILMPIDNLESLQP